MSEIEIRRTSEGLVLPSGKVVPTVEEAIREVHQSVRMVGGGFPVSVVFISDTGTHRVVALEEDGSVTEENGDQTEDAQVIAGAKGSPLKYSQWQQMPLWTKALAAVVLFIILLVIVLAVLPGSGTGPESDAKTSSPQPSMVVESVDMDLPKNFTPLTVAEEQTFIGVQSGKLEMVFKNTFGDLTFKDWPTKQPVEVKGQSPRVAKVGNYVLVQVNESQVAVVSLYGGYTLVDGKVQYRGTEPVVLAADSRAWMSSSLMLRLDEKNKDQQYVNVPEGQSFLGAIPAGPVYITGPEQYVYATSSRSFDDDRPFNMSKPVSLERPEASPEDSKPEWVGITGTVQQRFIITSWAETVVVSDQQTGKIVDQRSGKAQLIDGTVVVDSYQVGDEGRFIPVCEGWEAISGKIACPIGGGAWRVGDQGISSKPEVIGSKYWVDQNNQVKPLSSSNKVKGAQ
ncbi:hypothetical protein [Acaricomes phytoseiuli]|uniref:hypothetical protein n=1 Tax=Acaricomes phytoseiuli TaxID=291968 RepID=UPI00035CE9CD|nr:hypothetical protein [Acaricomes phytoseiuli]